MTQTHKNSRFSRFSLALTRLFCGSLFAGFASLYRRANDAFRHGFFGRVLAAGRLSPGARLRFKSSFSTLVEQSLIAGAYRRAIRFLLAMRLRAPGAFLFTFGFTNCLIYVVRRFLPQVGAQSPITLILGALLTLGSLPLLASRSATHTLAHSLLSSRFFGAFLEHSAGFRHEEVPQCEPRGGSAFCATAGAVLGAASLFFNPFYTLLFCGLFILAAMVFFKPEFGCVVLVFALPFVRALPLALLCLYVFFAFLMKVLRGKRTFRFELLDGAVLLFVLYAALSGVFAVLPDAGLSLRFAALCLSYFLVANLCRTWSTLSRLCGTFCVSVAVGALLFCLRVFFLPAPAAAQVTGLYFATYSVSPVLLLCAVPLCVALLLQEKKAGGRLVYLVCFALYAAALYALFSLAVSLCAGVSLLLVLLFYSRKFFFAEMALGLAALCALPLIPGQQTAFLPAAVARRGGALILSAQTISPAVLCFGFGLSDSETLASLLSGVGKTGGALNFYSQLLLTLGICGLCFLLLCVLFAAQKALDYYLNAPFAPRRLLAIAPLCALFSLFALGFAHGFLSDFSVFCPILILLALSRNAVNLAGEDAPAYA